jgi:DNA relaxase NicK
MNNANARFSEAEVQAAIKQQLTSSYMILDERQFKSDEQKLGKVTAVLCDRHREWIDYVDHKLDEIVGRIPANTPKSKHFIGRSMYYTVSY